LAKFDDTAYVPAGHGEQDAPLANLPAEHEMHKEEPEPEIEPLGQLVHVLEPVAAPCITIENLPAEHAVQE
jgi:hypothetical protein